MTTTPTPHQTPTDHDTLAATATQVEHLRNLNWQDPATANYMLEAISGILTSLADELA